MTRHLSQEDLVAYLLGQAAADRRGHIEEHLRACSVCSNELASMENVSRRLGGALGSAKRGEPTPGFVRRVKRALRGTPGRDSLPKEES